MICHKRYYNIGIATDTERGLVVPVIRHADKLSLQKLLQKLEHQPKKARQGKLTFDDLKGGTFSITSYGNIGGLFAVPVINYPQAAILVCGQSLQKTCCKR